MNYQAEVNSKSDVNNALFWNKKIFSVALDGYVRNLITRQLLAFQMTTTHKGNLHYETIVGYIVG